MKKEYLSYLKNVLGIEAVLLNEVGPLSSEKNGESFFRPAFFVSKEGDIRTPLDQSYKLLILNYITQPQESLFAPEVADLYGKMQAALKLPQGTVLAVDCVMNERPLVPAEVQSFFQADAVLMFSSDPEGLGQLKIRGGMKWLETFSPFYLLKNTEAKKVVWNDMQKIMREI